VALRLPPLPALRLFEAAGRLGSFKAAAEELGLTPSAVSHGVVALERWLGADLFDRRANGVVLNAAGRDYLTFVSEALAMIAVGTRRLPGPQRLRQVSVSLAPTFAARFLLPRLHDFRRLRPDIALTLDTAHRQVGFPVDDVDLAVRVARGPWPGLDSVKLFDETLLPVCAPALAGTDSGQWTLLHVASVTEDWEVWAEAAGLALPAGRPGITFDTIHMAIDAAAAGLGFAIGRRPLIDGDLAAGRLVAAGPTVAAGTSHWLITGPSAGDRPEVAAFARWLKAEVERASPAPQG